jgi:hypothetical protein
MTELDKIKLILTPQDLDLYSDDLLSLYLEDAYFIINDIRETEEIEEKYKPVAREIVIERINKMGAEGQKSHSEEGISRSWSSANISGELLARITPICK